MQFIFKKKKLFSFLLFILDFCLNNNLKCFGIECYFKDQFVHLRYEIWFFFNFIMYIK